MILALDTFSGICGVALVENGKTVASLAEIIPNGHSEKLLPAVHKVLADAGISRPDAVAVTGGPGSFTGLRIGFSTAKGLAMGWNCAFLSIPTFDGWRALLANEPAKAEIGYLVDARQGDWYGQVFSSYFVSGLECKPLKSWKESFPAMKNWVVESDRLPDEPDWEITDWLRNPQSLNLAVAVARLAEERFKTGDADDCFDSEPTYIKDFVAGIPKNPSLI